MKRFTIEISTDGNSDIVNLNPELAKRIRETPGDGVVHLFVPGSTAGLTTLEYESGLVKHDMPAALPALFPDDAHYDHEATWNDDNGHSHMRSAFIGAEHHRPLHQRQAPDRRVPAGRPDRLRHPPSPPHDHRDRPSLIKACDSRSRRLPFGGTTSQTRKETTMRTTFTRPSLGLALAAALLTLAGCGDTHESLMKESLDNMNKVNTVLDGVKDEASAKAAAPKLEALAAKMNDIQQRMNKIGTPTPEQAKALETKYEKEIETVAQKMMANTMRIAFQPALMQHLQPALSKMPDSGGVRP